MGELGEPSAVVLVVGAQVDGAPQHAVWLDWARLCAGGTIRYTLAAQAPEQGWDTDVADLPVSWCATPGSAMQ